jgi:FtsP/CotA-like multicopper oxidase with cupredoxin domain
MPQQPPYDRRDFLKLAGLAALGSLRPLSSAMAQTPHQEPADYTLRIASGRIDLGAGHTVPTTLYNGRFPGPLLRFKDGKRVIVDIHNDTEIPEVALAWSDDSKRYGRCH